MVDPDIIQPIGAAIVALAGAIVVLTFARRVRAFASPNVVLERGVELSFWAFRVQIGASFALAIAHAISLGFGILFKPTRAPIVVYLSESFFIFVWILIAVGKTYL